jgi:hypothetical protein
MPSLFASDLSAFILRTHRLQPFVTALSAFNACFLRKLPVTRSEGYLYTRLENNKISASGVQGNLLLFGFPHVSYFPVTCNFDGYCSFFQTKAGYKVL